MRRRELVPIRPELSSGELLASIRVGGPDRARRIDSFSIASTPVGLSLSSSSAPMAQGRRRSVSSPTSFENMRILGLITLTVLTTAAGIGGALGCSSGAESPGRQPTASGSGGARAQLATPLPIPATVRSTSGVRPRPAPLASPSPAGAAPLVVMLARSSRSTSHRTYPRYSSSSIGRARCGTTCSGIR